MKFRTQLIISMVFFGLALAIISASVISTNQQVERLNKQEELAKNIEFKVGELSYLSNDYLLYHESQQIDRWESKFSSISEDVSNLTVDRPEQQVHVNNIKSSQQQLKEIFGDIVSKINSSSSLQQNTVDPSFIQVSSSRLGVQTQGIIFDVSRLSQMLRDQADQTQQRSTTLVFSLVGAFIALLLANYLLFYRGTLRSIEFLQTGTKIIGSGNLDFSLNDKRNDEIGELSRSFNLMTANLKTVTASKSDLEREIGQRKVAENELIVAKDRIASDLDAMTRLHEISTRFVGQADIQTVLDEIVETAIAITHADMGNMHLFDANSGSIQIMAYNGFEQPFLDYWNSVHEGRGACGTALERGERVIVEDVTKSPIFVGTPALQVQLNAGVRAVQSTPLSSRSGNLLGMLSTHYRTCRRPEEQDLRLLDLLARLTADIIEHRQVEQALRENEQKYSLLFERSAVAASLTKLPENVFADVNEAFEKLFGYTRQEIVGKTSLELGITKPEEHAVTVVEIEERGLQHDAEKHVRTKSGVERIVLLNVNVLELGGQRYTISTMQDITERKRAEEALQESEERFRSVLDNTSDVIVRMNLQTGRYEYVSSSVEALVGYSPDEFQVIDSKTALAMIYPEDLPVVRAALARSEDSGKAEAEYRQRSKNGDYIWVSSRMSVVKDSSGRPLYRINSIRDITERKRAEEILKTSEERARDQSARLQAVLDAAPAIIWTSFDPECKNISGNRAAYDFSRVPEGTDMSKTGSEPSRLTHYRIFKDGIELAPEEMPIQCVAAHGQELNNQSLDFRFDDGTVRSLLGNVTPILDSKGKPSGAVAAFMDITERKRAEDELRKSRDELEQRVQERTAELSDAKENLEAINEELEMEISEHEETEKNLLKAKETAEAAVEAKTAFLANMSHELRTPMNAVIGFSNLLLDESLTPDQKDYIERIKIGGEALLGLINDILDFSKMEKNKMERECQPLSLRALVDESLDMVVVQANNKGLNLALTINYGTPDTILGDHGRLRQVLVNLLSNAIKFTDAGGVSVSISSKPKENNRHQILFSVKDTGMGIPEDKVDTLFQPFSQIEMTISSHRGGTGLGLAISKRLVELMGGKIWVESEQGKGSTFSFYIEAEVARSLPTRSEIPDQPVENLAEQHPMKILVAEDVPSNQKVLVEMLKRMGYRADMAADGLEVLQALERQPYDLVLMDVKMPEMDGITAVKEIRRLWPNNGPKVVAITAYAMEGDREKCLEAGMDDYIAKPVQKGELAEVLKRSASLIG